MSGKTKISKLKAYLQKGGAVSPIIAQKLWGMAHNTFNRQIWELRHKHGMAIESHPVIAPNGDKFNMHWIEW